MKNQPVVAFLIPFASKKAKERWDTACTQLRQTIDSILNSWCGDFCVVVAGHERPEIEFPTDPRFVFCKCEHPFPKHRDPGVAVRRDKLTKIQEAWREVKERWNPHFVMKLDADDFISAGLVGWLSRNTDSVGFLIRHGWLWADHAKFLIEKTEYLDRICGSCLIIRSDLANSVGPFLTHVEGVELSRKNLDFAVKDHYSLIPGSEMTTLLLNDSHQRYAAQFESLGHQLPTLPFTAIIYRTFNSDSITSIHGWKNTSGSFRALLGKIRRVRLINSEIREEFSLP